MPDLEVLESDLHPAAQANGMAVGSKNPPVDSNFPSFTTMFLLWIVGLSAWLYYAIQTTKSSSSRTKRKVKDSINPGNYKDK